MKLSLFESVEIERLKDIERNTAGIGTNQDSEEGNALCEKEKENQPKAMLLMRGHIDSLTSTKESLCHIKSLQSNSSEIENLRRTKGCQSRDHFDNYSFSCLLKSYYQS